jgi:hypothetical protein
MSDRPVDVLAPADTADPVSDALRAVNVRSTVFCLSELGAPWGFRVEGTGVAKFHLVLAGSGWLTLDGQEPVAVDEGELVVLPRGQAHTLADRPGSMTDRLDDLLADYPGAQRSHVRMGGDGPQTRLLCGGFGLGDTGTERTLELLPDVVRLAADAVATTAWLSPLMTMLQSEAVVGEAGSGAVVAKLADVCLTQALRVWLVGAERAGLLEIRQL